MMESECVVCVMVLVWDDENVMVCGKVVCVSGCESVGFGVGKMVVAKTSG